MDTGWEDLRTVSGPSLASSLLSNGNRKISDAVSFGPRFRDIFHKFSQDCHLEIDTNRHLFVLILEYLVDFVRWVRRDDMTAAEVGNLLYNSDYLRPETRNGVITVIIYVFSAIKSLDSSGLDMFSVLVDEDDGLGIANRFSLKIYNDPFGYLMFLKLGLSALIDCGIVPENDRLNTVNRTLKARPENAVELEFFIKIKNEIVAELTVKNHYKARSIVNTVVDYWQDKKKNILRGKQFSSAYKALHSSRNVTIPPSVLVSSQASSTPVGGSTSSTLPFASSSSSSSSSPLPTAAVLLPTIPMSTIAVPLTSPLPLPIGIPPHGTFSSGLADISSTREPVSPRNSNEYTSSNKRRAVAFESYPDKDNDNDTSTSASSSGGMAAVPSYRDFSSKVVRIQRIQGLRYTRIGRKTWTITQMAIYDLPCLLSTLHENANTNPQIFLIDSLPIQSPILQVNGQYTTQNKSVSSSQASAVESSSLATVFGITNLREALAAEGVLITDWMSSDPQLLLFWSILKSVSSRNLIDIWSNRILNHPIACSTAANGVESDARGFIAIEVDMQIIFCVRKMVNANSNENSNNSNNSNNNNNNDNSNNSNNNNNSNNSNNNDNNTRDSNGDSNALGTALTEDVWCRLYPEDLHATNATDSMGDLLCRILPQVRKVFPRRSEFAATIVKYKATPLSNDASSLPLFDASTQAMETIGCLDKLAVELFCKLSPHQVCHNFVLDYCA